MATRLSHVTPAPQPGQISRFEQGKREPSLLLLLEYARLAGISTDVLIDDKIVVPAKLSGGLKREKRHDGGTHKKD